MTPDHFVMWVCGLMSGYVEGIDNPSDFLNKIQNVLKTIKVKNEDGTMAYWKMAP